MQIYILILICIKVKVFIAIRHILRAYKILYWRLILISISSDSWALNRMTIIVKKSIKQKLYNEGSRDCLGNRTMYSNMCSSQLNLLKAPVGQMCLRDTTIKSVFFLYILRVPVFKVNKKFSYSWSATFSHIRRIHLIFYILPLISIFTNFS